MAGARRAALGVECGMTGFGVYLAFSSIGGFLAGGVGALLSCAAVACLLDRSARGELAPKTGIAHTAWRQRARQQD